MSSDAAIQKLTAQAADHARAIERLRAKERPYAYVPLLFANRLTSTSFDGDAFSTTAKTLIDLSAVFGAPAGIKAVVVAGAINDSGSTTTDCFLILGDETTTFFGVAVTCDRTGNDRFSRYELIVPCDANGDIYYQIAASGAGTFDLRMAITGYWI